MMVDAAIGTSRVVPLGGGINFRDLGGYLNEDGRRVKWRKILRCGHLANLTDQDLDTLEQIGVSKIHDFRRQEEQQSLRADDCRLSNINRQYQGFGSFCSRESSPRSLHTNWSLIPIVLALMLLFRPLAVLCDR